MKILLLLLALTSNALADVLQPPISETDWIPFWVNDRLGPFVDFDGPTTYYYEGDFSSPPFTGISPLGTFSYSDGLLSWDTPSVFALWVYDVETSGDVQVFKINGPFHHSGSVQIGDSPNLVIYGKSNLPDMGSTLALFVGALLCLALARLRYS